jgi:hypothetical protein
MRIFLIVLCLSCLFLTHNLQAATTQVPLSVSSEDLQSLKYQPFSFGSSFFIVDRGNKSLLQVDAITAQVTTLFNFPEFTLIAHAPSFTDGAGKLFILILEATRFTPYVPKLAVIDLSLSPSTYTTRALPAELSKLESGENDQTQMFSGAAATDGKVFILDNSFTIHQINADNSYGGGTNASLLSASITAERVNFALAPNGLTLAVIGYKDGPSQTRKISLYNVTASGLVSNGKTAKLKGTYPESILFSKDGKNIFIGTFHGVERVKASTLKNSVIFKSRKALSDGVYNLLQGTKHVFAVFQRGSQKIYSLLKIPDSKGLGVKLAAKIAGKVVFKVAANSADNQALVAVMGEGDSLVGGFYLVDLK